MDEIKQELMQKRGKLVKISLREGSSFFLRWAQEPLIYLGPTDVHAIVSSHEDIPHENTPLHHPNNPNIKVRREHYFMSVSEPRQLAGYVERLYNREPYVELWPHPFLESNPLYPRLPINIKAIENIVEL